MKFTDRQSKHPGRYKMVTASGEVVYVTLTRADEPTAEGTLLNAYTFNTMIDMLQHKVHEASVVE